MNKAIIIGGSSVAVTALLLTGILLFTGEVVAYPQLLEGTTVNFVPESDGSIRVEWSAVVQTSINTTEVLKDRFFVNSGVREDEVISKVKEQVQTTFNARYPQVEAVESPAKVKSDDLNRVFKDKTLEVVIAEKAEAARLKEEKEALEEPII